MYGSNFQVVLRQEVVPMKSFIVGSPVVLCLERTTVKELVGLVMLGNNLHALSMP